MAGEARQPHRDYLRIEQALHYLGAHYKSQPDLAEIAASVNLSEAHFQRLFKRWAGVSPKQFLQYLTLNHARQCLQADMTVLDAALDSGLSAPARLNELFLRLEAITPLEFKQAGAGIEIQYGFHLTAFGCCLIGVTERGVTGIAFCDEAESEVALADMTGRLPRASYSQNQGKTAPYCEMIFGDTANTGNSKSNRKPNNLSLLVRGTPFQLKVWEALLRVDKGSRVSYRQLAELIGQPTASRAVGTAVGRNPIAVLIPCHRVIREDGLLGGYHWGLERKLALLGVESVQKHGLTVDSHNENTLL